MEVFIIRSKLVILVGPSGVGKTTVAKAAVKAGVADYALRSITDRPRGVNESEDEYIFVNKGAFDISKCFEHAEYSGNNYGISKDEVERALKFKRIIAVTEINGAKTLKKELSGLCDVVLVFLDAPDAVLLERLKSRGRGSVEERMERVEKDRCAIPECDHVFLNDQENLSSILNAIDWVFSIGEDVFLSMPPLHDAAGNPFVHMACDGACTKEGRGGCAWYDGKAYNTLTMCGKTTNNKAEYTGLLMLLVQLRDSKFSGRALILMDSMLVVKQMNGEYSVSNEGIIPLHRSALSLCSILDVTIMWVPREFKAMNTVDKLAKEAARC